jgi:uncharacterized protein (TIGR02118 family)
VEKWEDLPSARSHTTAEVLLAKHTFLHNVILSQAFTPFVSKQTAQSHASSKMATDVTAAKNLCAAVVSYPSKTESGEPLQFDMDYYFSGHMPLIEKAWAPFGMKSWHVNRVPDKDVLGQSPPYGVITTIYFDTPEDFVKALTGPMANECSEDVKKFSNVMPSIWVGNVTGTKSY